eukprot:410769-Pyramimonas_sp.AAC.1
MGGKGAGLGSEGVVWSSEDADRTSTPTTDRESRCTVHKGIHGLPNDHQISTTVTFKIPRTKLGG